MKKLIVTISYLVCALNILSQNQPEQVISSAGTFSEGTGVSFLWTVGEPIVGITDTSKSVFFTQGIGQSYQMYLQIVSDSLSCFGSDDGYAEVQVSGGIPPFTYLWSNAADINSISNLVPGEYSVTVTDLNGFSASDTVNIYEPDQEPAPNVFNDTICFGETPMLSATGSNISWYNLNWQLQYTGNNFTPSDTEPDSTYSYLATTTINGCESRADTAKLIINPVPVFVSATVVDELFCNSSDGSIEIFAIGDAPLTYSINAGNDFYSDNLFTGLANSNYPVVVQNTYGCFSDDTSLVVSSGGAPGPPVVNITDSLYCEGESLAGLIATPLSGGVITWYSNEGLTDTICQCDTIPPYNIIGTTNYYATETTGECRSVSVQSIITINEPYSAPVVDDIEICYSDTVEYLVISGENVQWYDDPLLTNLVHSGDTLNTSGLTEPGIYTYYVTQTDEACGESPSDTVSINIYPKVMPNPNDTVVCEGDAIPVLYAEGTEINWYADSLLSQWLFTGNSYSTGETTPASYTYYLTNTENGCISNDTTITLLINSLPEPPVVTDSVICEGESNHTLTATGSNVTWYSSINMDSIVHTGNTYIPEDTLPGTYYWYVTQTQNNCESDYNIVSYIINAIPATLDDNETLICYGDPIPELSASGSEIKWYDLTESLLHEGEFYTPEDSLPGTYNYLISQSLNGCESPKANYIFTINNLEIDAGPDLTVIHGTDTSLNVTELYGSGFYSYIWEPSEFMVSENIQNPGTEKLYNKTTFVVTVTDLVYTCTDTDSVIVNITGDALQVSPAAESYSICPGDTTQLFANPSGGTGNYSIIWWSDSAGMTSSVENPLVKPSLTTNYYVEVNDGYNKDTAMITISIYDLLQVNAGNDQSIPFGNTTSLNGSVTGGSGSYTNYWSPGDYLVDSTILDPLTISLESPIEFELKATDISFGCENSDKTMISITGGALEIVDLRAVPTEICLGENSQLSVTPNGGTGSYSYQWLSDPYMEMNDSVSNPVVAPIVTTEFTIIVSDGATTVDSVITITVIEIPVPGCAPDKSVCYGQDTPDLEACGTNLKWYDNVDLLPPVLATDTIYSTGKTQVGDYYYYVTSTAGNCESQAKKVTLRIDSLPDVSFTDLDNTYCNDETCVTLTGVPSNGDFTGNGISLNTMFCPTDANVGYNVITYTYTDINSCTDSSTQIVLINEIPAADAGEDKSICNDDCIQIGTNPLIGHAYSWQSIPAMEIPEISNPLVCPIVTTTFFVTDSMTTTGCTSTDIVNINVNPVYIITENHSICEGDEYPWQDTLITNAGTYSRVFTSVNGCDSICHLILTVDSLPVADVGVDRSICYGDSTQIGAAGMGGRSYSWTSDIGGFISSISNPEVSPVETTTYYLQETTDATGCEKSDSVTITVNPLPQAIAGEDQTICFGESKQISSESISGHTYSWTSDVGDFSSNTSNPEVSPAETTTYYLLESIDATGCIDMDTVIVTVNPLPDANAGIDYSLCIGESRELGTDSIAGNSYKWSSIPIDFESSEATPMVFPEETTDFILTVTNDASVCFKIDTVVITVNPLPEVNAGNDASICFGESHELGVDSIPGNSYQWISDSGGFESSEATPEVFPEFSTDFILTVINASACLKTDTIRIVVNELPTPDAGIDAEICLGECINIGAISETGHSYSWISEPGLEIQNISNPEVCPELTTTFYLVDSINESGCTDIDTVEIIVNELPDAYVGLDDGLCLGESKQIGSTGQVGHSYSWTSNPPGFSSIDPNPLVTPQETTAYYLLETIESTGCDKTDSVTITVYPNPVVSITNFDNIDYVYEGDSISLTASGANTYEWFSEYADEELPDQPNVYVNPTHARTMYSVVGTNSVGACTDMAEYTVYIHCAPCESSTFIYSFEEPYSTINHGCEDFYYTNNMNCEWRVVPEGASSIHYYFSKFKVHPSDWIRIYSGSEINSENLIREFNNENLPPAISEELLESRILIVFETDNSLVDEGFLLKIDDEPIVNINPVDSENSMIDIFPNPSQGEITVSYNGIDSKEIELKVFNIIGNIIVYDTYETNYKHFEKKLDVNNLRDGMYFIEIITDDSKFISKFLIKK